MLNNSKKKAVIYFRPEEQKSNLYRESTSSQLERCYTHCAENEYEVIEVFYDNSIHPYSFDVDVFDKMLDFIDIQPAGTVVVVFNDLLDFSRDFRELLRVQICVNEQRFADIECINYKFHDTPHGRLVEKTVDLLKQISVL